VIEQSESEARSTDVIGAGTSQREGAQRWSEIDIIRAAPPGAGYVVRNTGKTLIPGEEEYRGEFAAHTSAEVVAWLLRGKKRLSLAAQQAVDAATLADPEFAAGLGDALRAETIGEPFPKDGSIMWAIPRINHVGNALDLRFAGRLIALRSSKGPGKTEWLVVSIFAADSGGYVVDSHAETANDAPLTESTVEHVPTALDAMDALLAHNALTTTAWLALDMAAKEDARFGAELGDRHRRAFARFAIVELRHGEPKGYQRSIISAITVASIVTAPPHAVQRILRVSRKAVGGGIRLAYLHVRTLDDPVANPVRASAVQEFEPYALARYLGGSGPQGRALLAQATMRDLDLARAVARETVGGIALPIAAREPPGDDLLLATMPRKHPADIPPPWD